MLSIGLMSGTSMDGIDAALLETNGSQELKELGQYSLSYPPAFKVLLKAAEWAVRQEQGHLDLAETRFTTHLKHYLGEGLLIKEEQIPSKIKELADYLEETPEALTLSKVIEQSTLLHLAAILSLLKQEGYQSQEIDCIGYHGQTLFHRPSLGCSVIVGDGAFLAKETGITVVNDFRRHDLSKGGEGAPFAPLFHQALAIRDKRLPLAVVNCGGIANISLIPNDNILDLSAFDTGPGNGLIDRLIRMRTQGKMEMDRDGEQGLQGTVHESCLAALYEKSIRQDGQNYFAKQPPKALDIGDLQLIPELDQLSLPDACRTLEAFTADSIVKSLEWQQGPIPSTWILAGGGWNNPVIYQELKSRLEKKLGANLILLKADEAGWNNSAVEAQIFAYFAVRALQNKPLSVPGTTRVPQPVSGGQAYLPPKGATAAVQALLANNPEVLNGYR